MTHIPIDTDDFEQLTWLKEVQTAARLIISPKLLQKWRYSGGPLPYAKFGGAIRYALADIEQFERASRRTSTSDPGTGHEDA